MLTNATQKLLFLFSLIACVLLTACQKDVDVDLDNPPPIPDEVEDSTLLVKSITMISDEGKDTIVESYFYDTVNKKITLSWKDNFFDPGLPDVQSELNNSKADFSYNNKGLLTRVVYHYPATYTPWDFDYKTIDLVYDNENVLKKVTVKYMNGEIEEQVFTKTMIAGGNYFLAWNYVSVTSGDSSFRKVQFDKVGNVITSYGEHYYYPPQGGVVHLTTYIDSMAYNAGGSVEKIFTKIDKPGTNEDKDYILYEYAGRQAKGDQLYNQRQVLMNGIANIPFTDLDDIASGGFGILSFVLDYEYVQYLKFPAQLIKAQLWDGTIKNFTVLSEFDSKDRLTKFTGFIHDYDLEPTEFTIRYYK